MSIKISLSLLTILLSTGLIFAQATVAAKVTKLEGSAEIQRKGNEKIRKLRVNDKIYSGDKVRCGRYCVELIITKCKVREKRVTNKHFRKIRASGCGDNRKNIRGGRKKSDDALVISPFDGQVIYPETFSVRWKPTIKPERLVLVLRVANKEGGDLWCATGIDGRKGNFRSNSLTKKLKEASLNNDLIITLKLFREKDSRGAKSTVFRLMRFKKQENLKKEIAYLNEESDILFKSVEASLIYYNYRLYEESTREIENALNIARKRRKKKDYIIEITKLAIASNYKFYQDKRVKQLCLKLEESEKPGVCQIIED